MVGRRKSRRKKDALRARSGLTRLPIEEQVPMEPSAERGSDHTDEQESWYSDEWETSRSGARASRGFHFQHAVGAWLASKLASAKIVGDTLIPEGFDDMQIDAIEPIQLEIKSRQGRLGTFPVGLAAHHIVAAWIRHVERFRNSRRLVVVLEQGIENWRDENERDIESKPVSEVIGRVESLDAALSLRLSSMGRPSHELEAIKDNTSVVICTWDHLTTEIEDNIRLVVNLPAGAVTIVGRQLMTMIADAVSSNAEIPFTARETFDRTRLIDAISSIAALINLESIEQTVSQGICTPVSIEPDDVGDIYYEGIATQPGHVSAGLVVPRPDVVSQVMAGVQSGQSVLLVGPSGVGKSAAIWTLPFAFPGVLWFRINRISDSDVSQVIHLLRVYGVSTIAPVGLLVDGVGREEFSGWTSLQRSIARIPGAYLIGTSRNEDLHAVGNLTECSVIRVTLDEDAASTIHAGLLRRGATSVPHWQEAFEQAGGLTLEFTYILTQGARLQKMLAEQVEDRLREGRSLELKTLALVATSDRYSVSITSSELEVQLGVEGTELRRALSRLVEEHLVVDRHGEIGGIHQIRSRILVDVIHAIPPPSLEQSVTSVLKMLHGPSLSRYVYEVLREFPHLDESVLMELQVQIHEDTERLIDCLRGLEFLDFYRLASTWVDMLVQHDIPLAFRSLVMAWAVTEIDPKDILPSEIQKVIEDIRGLADQSATRDWLLERAGMDRIASELGNVSTTSECVGILEAMRHSKLDWEPLLDALKMETPLVRILKKCDVEDFADCVSSASDVSIALSSAFVGAAGGPGAVLDRIRNRNPWIQKLEVVEMDGQRVGVARFLHINEIVHSDPLKMSHEISRLLLRSLPDIDIVDVKPILPGGQIYKYRNREYGSSKLSRENALHPSVVRYNQARIRVALTLLGVSDTERLTQCAELLSSTAALLKEFGNVYALQRDRSSENRRLGDRCRELSENAVQLPGRIGHFQLGDEGESELNDWIAGLVSNVCNTVLPGLANRSLNHAQLSNVINTALLGRYIPNARNQAWELIGVADSPSSLDEISSVLSDLEAVITELAQSANSYQRIINEARRGSESRALSRAAGLSRRRINRRTRKRRESVARALRLSGLHVDVLWYEGDLQKGEPSNFAVAVGIHSIDEWQAAYESLVPKVEEVRSPGEFPIVVPVINGKTVPLFATQLILGPSPIVDLGEFGEMLPQPLDLPLTNSVTDAFTALQVLSGLSVLGDKGSQHEEALEMLNGAMETYECAIEFIRKCGDEQNIDGLLSRIDELHDEVLAEWSDQTRIGSFASGMSEGILQNGSPESRAIAETLTTALLLDSAQVDGSSQ